ncbi:MAG TPA: ribonuclease R [Planctomycetes bacterium]|nr:ribonuclease R [Planctomycetota bacterium]
MKNRKKHREPPRNRLDNAVSPDDVIDFINQPGYTPMTSRQLARVMGAASPAETHALMGVLARLEKDARLVRDKNDRCIPASREHPAEASGRIEVKAGGFGFVHVEGMEDVFIPPGALGGALDGDMVEIRVRDGASGRGPEGVVTRVAGRAQTTVTGIFYPVRKSGGYVLADHPSLNDGIDVPPDKTLDARNGDKVRVKITRWPAVNKPAQGEVAEVFGQAGDWQAELASVVSEYGLRTRFTDEVLAAAEQYGEHTIQKEAENRIDLRRLPTITIDPEDAKDFDDAVSLERTHGGWKLYVHIADVAHFVRPDDPVDREARIRTTSVYLPGQVFPMLPPKLTRDICCLRPDVDRLAMTVIMDFDVSGRRKAFAITPSVIHSDVRLNYNQVKEGLEAKNRSAFPAGIYELLADMHGLAQILRAARTAAGSINLDMPEPRLSFDETGRITSVTLEQSDFSHQLVEEFMLSANRAVADYLARWNLPAIYRIHDEPDEDAMKRFSDFAAQYGLTLKSPYTRKKLQGIVDFVADKPFGHVIQMMMLRSMKKAIYSNVLKPHYALGFDRYLHFTSPIRRYPDLFVHRVLHEIAAVMRKPLEIGSAPARSQRLQALEAADTRHLAEYCSLRERAADAAEERLTRFRQIEFVRERLHDEWDGTITGMSREGLYVELTGAWVTGLLPVAKSGKDAFSYDRKSKKLTARRGGKTFALGNSIRVAIERADMISQEIVLQLAKSSGEKTHKRTKR